MAEYSQTDRIMRVETALGKDVLLLKGLTGDEGISMPFHFTLDLLSEKANVKAADLLRKPVVVHLELPGGKEKAIHGIVSRFVQLDQSEGGELTAYRAEMVPWLWFLSMTADCKIFQDKTVLEIVEQVFKDQGYSDFEIKCVKSYPKREFCVQYRESHLNFVSRLLEEEGIFYFFRHTGSKHVLPLADNSSAVKACEEQSTVRMAAKAGKSQAKGVVLGLECEQAAHLGRPVYGF